MCGRCDDAGPDGHAMHRRAALRFGAAGLAALGLGFGAQMLPRAAWAASGTATTKTPDEALAGLKAGNERYLADPQHCTIDLAKQRVADGELFGVVTLTAGAEVGAEQRFASVGTAFVARVQLRP